MSDEKELNENNPASGADELFPEFEENEEDVLLQAQMWVYNLVMAHWKKMLYGFGGVLGVVLLQGLYADSVVNAQREIYAESALVKEELPEVNPLSQYGLAPKDSPADTKRMAQLRASAKELERIGTEGKGTAAWFAWMDAAGVWERAYETDAQMVALGEAAKLDVNDHLKAISTLQLANVYANHQKEAEAIAVLQGLLSHSEADLQAQAGLNLARIYMATGDSVKAKEALASISQAPQSLQMDILSLQTQLEG